MTKVLESGKYLPNFAQNVVVWGRQGDPALNRDGWNLVPSGVLEDSQTVQKSLCFSSNFTVHKDSRMPTTLVSRNRSSSWIWQTTLLLLLLGLVYKDVMARLAGQWWNDPNFSHGFFVPLFSAFVIWSQRKKLAEIPLGPSWVGLAILFLSLSVLVVGVLGAELFLSRASLVLVLSGLVIHFLGWAHFRALLFPLGFLFLMIPIPNIIFNQIAFPLQLLASQLAASFLQVAGVPTLRQGNVIQLPIMTLEVVEACSGIRSLITLLTLAIIYGYFLEPIVWKRWILALCAIPIAVFANGFRIVGTGLMGEYWEPEKAQGFFHSFSGWVVFVVALVLLFGVHSAMQGISRLRRRPA